MGVHFIWCLLVWQSSGSPPSAFQVPYDSFKHQFNSSETIDSDDFNSSGDASEQDEVKDLDYEFICFFLSSPRLDLYRLIDMRCEHMLSGGSYFSDLCSCAILEF